MVVVGFVISAVLCVPITSEIKQLNGKNEETEKHHKKAPKIYGKSHPFYSVHEHPLMQHFPNGWGKENNFLVQDRYCKYLPFQISTFHHQSCQAPASAVGQP